MKNIIASLLLIGVVGCSGSAGSPTGSSGHTAPYTVTVTVQDNVYSGASRQLHMTVDNDTSILNGNVNSDTQLMTASASFVIGNLQAGTYYLIAWKDVDSNGVFSTGDNYTGTPVQVVITNDDVIVGSNLVLDTVN